MHRWDMSPFSVTPAASLLSRCVSVGAVSQEEIDSASSNRSPAFSPQVQEAEQRIMKQKQLDELQLQLELLRVDHQSADVAHSFHLEVPAAPDVVLSPAGRPEGAEESQTETDEAAGSDQPAASCSPAQVCGGLGEADDGLHRDSGGEVKLRPQLDLHQGTPQSAGLLNHPAAG
ncbi:HAUS augmin-like complex subunit 2 isoform X2 [Acanthochromis polyacanthus]|uniref:HAUS augmin-like complex subunit 2 isoform X2 n=1 Tax=Acanthochromis polyacanthus TaxID=80966 RepID=UPI0022344EBF|nr:HAUS augmin-like complex subunit 2 isoform X2 [Acanthochromis polyacanthus]